MFLTCFSSYLNKAKLTIFLQTMPLSKHDMMDITSIPRNKTTGHSKWPEHQFNINKMQKKVELHQVHTRTKNVRRLLLEHTHTHTDCTNNRNELKLLHWLFKKTKSQVS